MSICWAGLLPHPPIIVPDVGGQRRHAAKNTINACEKLAQDMLDHRPERLILISPHAPRPDHGICAWETPEMSGNFAQFGAPTCQLEIPNDLAWTRMFHRSYPHLHFLNDKPLDHGTTVPLFFLMQAGWSGPTAVLGLPWSTHQHLQAIGQAIEKASRDDVKTAVLASGDMSHCLLEEGPYGFHPQGPKFDQLFVSAIRQGAYHEAATINPSIREPAKEDVLDSSIIAWHATQFSDQDAKFFNYEGPFGVGYSVMRYFGNPS